MLRCYLCRVTTIICRVAIILDTCVMFRCRQGSVGTTVTVRFRDPVDVSALGRVVSQSLLSETFTYTVNDASISVKTQGRQAGRGYLNPQYFGAVCFIKAPIWLVKITQRNIVPRCIKCYKIPLHIYIFNVIKFLCIRITF